MGEKLPRVPPLGSQGGITTADEKERLGIPPQPRVGLRGTEGHRRIFKPSDRALWQRPNDAPPLSL